MQLICDWSKHRRKDWFSADDRVTNTTGIIWTKSGGRRTLAFVEFDASLAGTYSCVFSSDMSTEPKNTTIYTVTLG